MEPRARHGHEDRVCVSLDTRAPANRRETDSPVASPAGARCGVAPYDSRFELVAPPLASQLACGLGIEVDLESGGLAATKNIPSGAVFGRRQDGRGIALRTHAEKHGFLR